VGRAVGVGVPEAWEAMVRGGQAVRAQLGGTAAVLEGAGVEILVPFCLAFGGEGAVLSRWGMMGSMLAWQAHRGA